MAMPIVNARGKIVGYTDETPELVGNAVRHAEAERLLGGAVKAIYLEIEDRAELMRAGAPPDWNGAWRCLALCSAEPAAPEPVNNILVLTRTAGAGARERQP